MHTPTPPNPSIAAIARQRGVTMVSVMLMTVSLMTLGLLAVRSSVREATEAGQLVSRERALMVAQAAVDLASAQYVQYDGDQIDQALVGFNAQGGACADPLADCIPGLDPDSVTGQRNDVLAGSAVGCGGQLCMRQGAVAFLRNSDGVQENWADVPFRDLVPNGDPDARVTVWVRNNSADALGPNGSGNWTDDNDGQVVVTAQARVRHTVVTIEQEIALSVGGGLRVLQPQSPDEGYGGGHNNDNSAVSVCTDDYVAGTAI
jgi:Tfp pilus assembly protein PilX